MLLNLGGTKKGRAEPQNVLLTTPTSPATAHPGRSSKLLQSPQGPNFYICRSGPPPLPPSDPSELAVPLPTLPGSPWPGCATGKASQPPLPRFWALPDVRGQHGPNRASPYSPRSLASPSCALNIKTDDPDPYYKSSMEPQIRRAETPHQGTCRFVEFWFLIGLFGSLEHIHQHILETQVSGH